MQQDQPAPPIHEDRPAGGRAPRERSRTWWILGTLGGLAFLLAVSLLAFTDHETTEAIEHSFATGDIRSVDLRVRAGGITVRVEDQPDIHLTSEHTTGWLHETSTEHTLHDGTLSVRSDCAAISWLSRCRADHVLTVPPGVVALLRIDVTAGAVEIHDFDGDTRVRATAGTIDLVRFSGDEADLASTAGRVTVNATEPPRSLMVETTAGDIELTVPDEPYRLSTAVVVGSVHAEIRESTDAPRSITASTTTGRVRIGTP